jgi:hypothetical protein
MAKIESVIPKTDVIQEIRRAAESLPEYGEFRRVNSELDALSRQREQKASEIAGIVKEADGEKKDPGSQLTKRAQALLANGSAKLPSEALKEAYDLLAVLDQAITLKHRELVAKRAILSHAANLAIRPQRQKLVSTVAEALKVLRGAVTDDAGDVGIMKTMDGLGVDRNYLDKLAFVPVSTELFWDKQWFEARRAEGYTTA